MLTFDHMKLVRRQPTEVKRFRDWVLSAQPGEFCEVAVVHENDGRCCRKEPWNATARALIEAMKPTVTQVMVNLL
jgi:hypothetical protein